MKFLYVNNFISDINGTQQMASVQRRQLRFKRSSLHSKNIICGSTKNKAKCVFRK